MHNLKWKSFFYLKPNSRSVTKETFGFKSTAPAPQVPELKNFENGLIDMVKNITFEHRPNTFQQKLNKDVKEIRKEPRVFVPGDKSTNFHKMLPEKYNELLEKSVQMEYKKASPQAAKEIEESHKNIVKSLDLQTRVYETTKREPFITVKDHKANFQNNTKCRLINPSKPEIGKISKQMLEKINSTIKQETGLNI